MDLYQKAYFVCNKLFEAALDAIIRFGFPTIWMYHVFVGNVFLNTAADDAVGLEKIGDTLLAPFQYVFGGKAALHHVGASQEWEFVQRFDYREGFWIKFALSLPRVPESVVLGSFVKGLGFFASPYEKRHLDLQKALQATHVVSHNGEYEKMGLALQGAEGEPFFVSQGYERRSGDELYLQEEKGALQEIALLLNQAKIPWWVDCGTLLGVYRYGGVIPWDLDIDIAVLLPDFDNVFRVLQKLDPAKYVVLDWSGRDRPKSYIKVCLKNARSLIDVYHFAIAPETRELRYILSLENNIFLPESWRVRERRFTVPISFDDVFPLRKSFFDGIEVFIPRNPLVYLQRIYGEDLSPIKLWDEKSGQYENDWTHPYWQRSHVH